MLIIQSWILCLFIYIEDFFIYQKKVDRKMSISTEKDQWISFMSQCELIILKLLCLRSVLLLFMHRQRRM